jgi:hypothetical protein
MGRRRLFLHPRTSRNRCHASRYSSKFASPAFEHRVTYPFPPAFSPERCTTRLPESRSPRKSNAPRAYFALFLRTEHTYPPPFFTVVDFTCTLTNRPGLPTTKSKLFDSPHGRLTGNPRSTARAMNTDSPHSPRAFASLMIFAYPRRLCTRERNARSLYFALIRQL